MTSFQACKTFSGLKQKQHTSSLIHMKNNCSDFKFNYANMFLQCLSRLLAICEVGGEHQQDCDQKCCVHALARKAGIFTAEQPMRTHRNTSSS